MYELDEAAKGAGADDSLYVLSKLANFYTNINHV